jgi:regulator of sigma E protease
MSLLFTICAFLLALGPLVIFHELGHYCVARLCGVKVLRFSVGMGKVVWSRKVGPDQTEWALSVLPLGGYVKMLDARDPDVKPQEHELHREFTRKNVWQRIAIVGAGPLANFILAIALMAGLYMHGVEEPAARLRAPAETSAIYQAGVRAGDRITAVNGTPVASWGELRWEIVRAAFLSTAAPAALTAPRWRRQPSVRSMSTAMCWAHWACSCGARKGASSRSLPAARRRRLASWPATWSRPSMARHWRTGSR